MSIPQTIKTGNFILAAAVASVDPPRTTIDIEPIVGQAEWQVRCVVSCPEAQTLWRRVHPKAGESVVPLQSDPVATGRIIAAIHKTSARLRDGASTIKRINCWEVCNG